MKAFLEWEASNLSMLALFGSSLLFPSGKGRKKVIFFIRRPRNAQTQSMLILLQLFSEKQSSLGMSGRGRAEPDLEYE